MKRDLGQTPFGGREKIDSYWIRSKDCDAIKMHFFLFLFFFIFLSNIKQVLSPQSSVPHNTVNII